MEEEGRGAEASSPPPRAGEGDRRTSPGNTKTSYKQKKSQTMFSQPQTKRTSQVSMMKDAMTLLDMFDIILRAAAEQGGQRRQVCVDSPTLRRGVRRPGRGPGDEGRGGGIELLFFDRKQVVRTDSSGLRGGSLGIAGKCLNHKSSARQKKPVVSFSPLKNG